MPRKRREVPWLDVRDGVYYINWYDEATKRTKRISTGATDAVEATKCYAAYLTEGHTLFRGDAGSGGLTVSDALDDYWREHVTQHVVDKGRQEDAIGHLKTWFERTRLMDVDIPASRAYANARRMGVVGGGKRRHDAAGADSTIRRELVVLQAAANHAARWKRIGPAAVPPTSMPVIEMPRETPQEAKWLTKEELARALAAATGRLRDFILVAYYTGARRASVERLTKFQVDLATGRLNLRAPTEDANQRRSVKRRPVVPIDAKLRPTLERLMAVDPSNSWLFGDNRDMYRVFREHMEGLGLADKAHPHILRHSRATHLLQSGVPIYDVARLLGDTVATIERVYGHHSSEYLAEAIKEG